MTQNFANRKKSKGKPNAGGTKKSAGRKKPTPTPPWILLLTGAVFGSLVTFLAFLSHIGSDNLIEINNGGQPLASNTSGPVPNTNNNQLKDTPPLVFEFIEMLKKQTVEVPDVTPTKRKNKMENKAYFIQAGSFKHYKDADALRARLIIKGFRTEIETTTNASGTTWYRLVVGPFTSRSKFHGAISSLANDNIDTLPLTRKIKTSH